jgi:hypothetical protein
MEGFDLFNYIGVPIMHYGPPDDDWEFIDSLLADEMKFDFETTFDLQNTKSSPITEDFHAYPNPFYDSFECTVLSTDSVLLKNCYHRQ